MITPAECQRVANRLRLATEPARLHILLVLADGERTVAELQAMLHINRPAAVRHLALLRTSALVQFRTNGSRHFYSLTAAGRAMLRVVDVVLR
jgi:ArsR family transcriptional regulator